MLGLALAVDQIGKLARAFEHDRAALEPDQTVLLPGVQQLVEALARGAEQRSELDAVVRAGMLVANVSAI